MRTPPQRIPTVIAEWVILTCLLVLLTSVMAQQDWFWRVDQTLYDLGITLMERPAPADVVIVAIDDESLRQIGRWPWRRAVHATLINRLTQAGARAVALDIILSEPDSGDVASDQALARALRASGKVVLPVLMEGGRAAPREIAPIPELRDAAAALGHVNVEIDADGIVRSAYLREGSENTPRDHLAVALLKIAQPLASAVLPGQRAPRNARAAPGSWGRDYWFHIPFAGGPGHFAQIPYVDVLRGDVGAERLKDKIVLIGANATGLSDAFPTPVSGLSRNMSGVEISANIIDAIRSKRAVTFMAQTAHAGIAAAVVFLLMLSYLWLTPRRALALTGTLFFAIIGAVLALLLTSQVWFAPSAALIGVVLGYPLWSWRRLEAAMRYLAEEIARLRDEPGLFRSAPSQHVGIDPLQMRINTVREATGRLRDLHDFIDGSLASLPDAAIVTNSSGTVMLANPRAAAYLNVQSAEHLKGQSLPRILEAVRKDKPPGWDELIHAAVTSLRAMTGEGRDADGRDLLVQLGPCLSSSGANLGLIVSLTNITALKNAERRRSELMRFLSHDLRAPQSAIVALLELMRENPAATPFLESLGRIERAARRTLALANDFVQLARAENRSPEFIPVDLVALMLDAADEMWGFARSLQVTIEHRFDCDEALVLGDRSMLLRALINLVHNAIKFGRAGSKVTLGLACASGLVTASVSDQGPGIAQENLGKLFQMYERFELPDHAAEEGVGLGLVYVKTVVEKHSGKIAVASEFGGGTRFTLTFLEAAKARQTSAA